ncbi:MAG TPA: DegT/DnrJ/EryC1/StrS aminotransferase family protein [Candidatus Limnocylindrales bacterium]|nr:DegT/DnrJ/EryC1/StrS aminotransferase family protein [Candidatus Limnocylindrales bacterium]
MTVRGGTGGSIAFHRPAIGEAEIRAAVEVLESGWLTTGERSVEFERAICERLGARHAVAVNSATAALHLALEALRIGREDEVIVPTYTFAASAEVVRYLGARPRLVDVDPATANVRVEDIEPHLGPRTRAIEVVHVGGLSAEIEPIVALARRHGLAVVEDAAHALPSIRNGTNAGTWGDAGALSFYATKTVTTGEGGMLVTDNDEIADRARVMRLHGISRDAWRRYTAGGSWYYEIEDVGFKYNLTDLAAAIGLVQLQRADETRLARERIADAYDARLRELGLEDLVDLPARPPAGDVHAWHLYPIRLREGAARRGVDRGAVIDALGADGIGTSVHFIPLHLHPYYRRTYGYARGDFPNAERAYDTEISLPIYPDLGLEDVDRVALALRRAIAGP